MNRNFITLIIIPLFLCLTVLPAVTARAADFTVTTTADTDDGVCDADCSLRDALSAANGTVGADTISIPAGTYTRAIPTPLFITDDVEITGEGAGATIIDGNKKGVVFTIEDNIVKISGVIIQGGITLLIKVRVGASTASAI